MSQTALSRSFDPADPALRRDPYPTYQWFREHDPVHRLVPAAHRDAPPRHFVFRASEVVAGLRDPRLVRAERRALWDESRARIPREWLPFTRTIRHWVLFQDPPEHTVQRRLIDRLVTGALPRLARSRADAHCRNSIEDIRSDAGDVFDLVREFAVIVPLRFIADALGIADADSSVLRRTSTAMMSGLGGGFTPERMRDAGDAAASLTRLFEDAVARHRRSPPADESTAVLLDGLIRIADEEDQPTVAPIAANCILLLLASHHNTANLIANGVLALLRHPEQWTALAEDPPLAAPAVNELLRFDAPVQLVSRHAAEPVELAGRTIERGEGVTFVLGSANRDPSFCPDPDSLRIARHRQPNLGFGTGAHECPGGFLVRLQVQAALAALTATFPKLALAVDEHAIEWTSDINFRGPLSLPVRKAD